MIEILSKDRYRFQVVSDVQFLSDTRRNIPSLSPYDHVKQIFKGWVVSSQPTYKPTWDGLFRVLRKMDLGHLVERIANCVTGSLSEMGDPSQTTELEGPAGNEKGCCSCSSWMCCMCIFMFAVVLHYVLGNLEGQFFCVSLQVTFCFIACGSSICG